MIEEHYYEVNLKWKNTKLGILNSPDLDTEIEVATPPEFIGGIPKIWSPEHLFTASINSCFMTTFLAIAEFSKLAFIDLFCSAKGKLDKIDGKYLMTEITLKPVVIISKSADVMLAEKILKKAENACLISNSIKSKVILDPKILIHETFEN